MRILLSLLAIVLAGFSLPAALPSLVQDRPELFAYAMTPASALAVLALGCVLGFWPHYREAAWARRIASVSILGIFALALYNLWLIFTYAYFGHLALMSPGTTLTLLALAAGLMPMLRIVPHLAADRAHKRAVRRGILLGQCAAIFAALVSTFVLTGYLYHSALYDSADGAVAMPRVTAVALLSLSFGVLAIYPRHGPMRFITNDGPSGEMAQFLLPVAVLVPIGLGWLRVVGVRAHLYDATFGLDLSAMLNVLMLGGLTMAAARKLYRSDQKARAVEQELIYRATHDSLTGLVNRAVFREQLQRRWKIAMRRPGPAFAVFYLDLDGFKQVNDNLGHDAGDRLLEDVAEILRRCTRASDTVARFGGDEFVILCEEIDNAEAAEQMAARIIDTMPRSFSNARESVKIGISIGIATSTDGHLTPDEMLRDADMALHIAKSGGKSRYEMAGAA